MHRSNDNKNYITFPVSLLRILPKDIKMCLQEIIMKMIHLIDLWLEA